MIVPICPHRELVGIDSGKNAKACALQTERKPAAATEQIDCRKSALGHLIPYPAAPGAYWQHPAGRGRGTLLRHVGKTNHGSVTQTKQPPENPGRFTANSLFNLSKLSVWWLRQLRMPIREMPPYEASVIPDQSVADISCSCCAIRPSRRPPVRASALSDFGRLERRQATDEGGT